MEKLAALKYVLFGMVTLILLFSSLPPQLLSLILMTFYWETD